MGLNVMVLESERGAADRAARELAAAGHVVLRCHEEGAPAFPCFGISDQAACPLRSHAVDVALTVRSRPRSQPAPQEDGVRCALVNRVPLVVAGPAVLDPYEGHEARVVGADEDVVAACEEVAAAQLPWHSRVATEALQSFTVGGRSLAGASASVHRRNGRLLVSVEGLGDLEARARDAAVVRMMARLRELDTSARGVDVVLGAPGEGAPTVVSA
jgi:hypothetical protein